jgi:hypothetical protein
MARSKPPKLRVVSLPAGVNPEDGSDDAKAWGLMFDVFDEALALSLSPATRRRLLRCRALVAALAGRPLLTAKGGGA